MIVYNLHCKNGHEFEGWFKDSNAFDAQAEGGKLRCPACDTTKVEKAIMAPAVQGVRKAGTADEARRQRQFVTGLRKYVERHADYVGPGFAEEARKIHYGEAPDRHIYGETTVDEAQALVEEGVDVAPLPPDPDGAN